MSLHLFTDRQMNVLKTIIDKVEKGTLNIQGRQPDERVDREEIFLPETYIARSPLGGIPAMAPAVGTGTGAASNYPRPGYALCDLYQEVTFQGTKVLMATGDQKLIANVGDVAINGLQFFTPTRDKYGTWLVPVTGFQVQACDAATGTGTSSGGTTGTNSCFWQGNCGDTGIPETLTASITSKVGCYADLPDSLTFSCTNNGADHYYVIDPTSLSLSHGDNTGSSAADVGSFASWSTPSNALSADGSKTIVTMTGTSISNNLEVTGYNFPIPTGSTITGIKVTVRYSATSNTNLIGNGRVDLLGVSGVSQKSQSLTSVSSADVVYGGVGDLWGATSISPSDVNSSSFGAAFSVLHNSGTSSDPSVDVIFITIYYNLETVCGQPLSGWVLGCSPSGGSIPNINTGDIVAYVTGGFAGMTCSPLSAVFDLDNLAGSTCTITVVE